MSKSIKDGKLLYHLTSLENAKEILKSGLKTRKTLLLNKEIFDDTADKNILISRSLMDLDEYVPFHFFIKTPYCGSVMINNPDIEFVYITIKRNFFENNPNAYIIPSHPLSSLNTELLSYKKGFDKIDWELVEKRDYSDLECKEACMCEALHKGDVNVECIHSITVKTEEAKKTLEQIKKEKKLSLFIDQRNDWFIK